MNVEILYLTKGRRAYTEYTLATLFDSTDWSLVDRLVVYDDGSSKADVKWLKDMLYRSPAAETILRQTSLGSPVAVMNHYLDRTQAKIFAKIDNDIMVPPGWLETMLGVIERNPELELLGMEPGMSDVAVSDTWVGVHDYSLSSHIGGVGLMRASAFHTRPRPTPDGRFGFTEWQHEHEPVRGWVCPDLRVFALNQIPFEPWLTIGDDYVAFGIQRVIGGNYPDEMAHYWDWAIGEDA